jgi:NAD(P)-dependent dehydrogenase (short-subunit alcohol dehydrogenase family)
MKEKGSAGIRLMGKVVVVTGATKGIGGDIAALAAREGASVVVSGRDAAAGEAVAARISAAGGSAAFVAADVAVAADCEHLVSAAVARFGRLDGLVNNAGIFPRASLLETDEAFFDRVFGVDLKGAFFCCRFGVAAMIRGGGGSVVNIGSTHAWAGSRDLAAYGVAKGALHTLTRHIAKNYARDRVRANWVTVGWVETPGEVTRVEAEGRDAAWLRRQGEERVPLGRLQTGEDIAWATVYLLSDEAAQVTGTEIHVSGGFLP